MLLYVLIMGVIDHAFYQSMILSLELILAGILVIPPIIAFSINSYYLHDLVVSGRKFFSKGIFKNSVINFIIGLIFATMVIANGILIVVSLIVCTNVLGIVNIGQLKDPLLLNLFKKQVLGILFPIYSQSPIAFLLFLLGNLFSVLSFYVSMQQHSSVFDIEGFTDKFYANTVNLMVFGPTVTIITGIALLPLNPWLNAYFDWNLNNMSNIDNSVLIKIIGIGIYSIFAILIASALGFFAGFKRLINGLFGDPFEDVDDREFEFSEDDDENDEYTTPPKRLTDRDIRFSM